MPLGRAPFMPMGQPPGIPENLQGKDGKYSSSKITQAGGGVGC